jgi:hypothetical protein
MVYFRENVYEHMKMNDLYWFIGYIPMTMETQEIVDPTASILKLPNYIWGVLKSHGDSPVVTLSVSIVSRGHRRLDWWHVVAIFWETSIWWSPQLRKPIIHNDWPLRPFEKILYRFVFFPGWVRLNQFLSSKLAWLMWIWIELEIKLRAKSACSQWSNLVWFELILIWSVDCFV